MNDLHFIAPAFIQQLSLMEYPEWVRLVLQFSIFLASAVLAYFMYQFKSRTPLDNSLLLREVAFTILFGRFVYVNLSGHASSGLIVFSYAFVAVACLLVVANVVRMRRHNSLYSEEFNSTDTGEV